MPQIKLIKNRIKSVKSTKKLTEAMKLVASSKIGRAMENMERVKPYFETLRDAAEEIAAANTELSSPYCAHFDDAPPLKIVIAGDRGLAGGYNMNVFKSLDLHDGDVILPIGKKTVDWCVGRGVEILTRDYASVDSVRASDCAKIAKIVCGGYADRKFSSVTVHYTRFINMLSAAPTEVRLLPFSPQAKPVNEKKSLTLYEPSAEAVFSRLIPQYVGGIIYGAVTSSVASELSARRNAMQSATNNAEEMISDLTLKYNRARQSAITQEITEIVAGDI